MALTKLPKNAIGTGAVKANNIADGTIQNTDISGCASVSADKLSSSLDLSTKSVTFANNEISNAELANSSFTLNGTSVSLGGSQSIITYLDWQAVQVADGSTQVNAEVNKGYFLDTNAGVIEVFLPTSPTRGDVVGLVDYSGTFGTNQLIINTGGVNIDSTVGSEFKITTNNAIVECVYVDSAKGWLIYLNQAAGTTPDSILTEYGYDVSNTYITATGGTISTSGDYKIHTFTGDGCFVVSAGAGPFATVDYLVIAGGGGGSAGAAGAGGAGGFRESHSTPVSGCYTASPLASSTGLQLTATTYPITVGGGGAGGTTSPPQGSSGSNSIFSTITSAGGGGGGYNAIGISGGSGGGGGVNPAQPGGTGNTPPTSPPQGQPGGAGIGAPTYGGGGGGGATEAGQNAPGNAGRGGAGATTSISTSPTAYSGGGGGGGSNQGASGGAGSPCGTGGAGGPNGVAGTAGTTNRGGGGGGASNTGSIVGGAGGKGIVIIRYKFQ